jgi:hypothetical protein
MALGRLAFLAGAIMALTMGTAQAQWSIGQPGNRVAPQGQQRYVLLVMIDPNPGQETIFNDYYQNLHMGDLVQLPGWMGAQRFRWMPGVTPRNVPRPFVRGNLIIWDMEGDDLAKVSNIGPVIGGKSRIIAGFDYTAGASVSGTYQVIGPRITRPDGKKAFMPPVTDLKTPRPNRYIMMDYYDQAAGVTDAAFETSLNARIREGLGVNGFMAAQLFKLPGPPPTPAPNRVVLPKYFILWETEASALIGPPMGNEGAQSLQDAFTAASKAGQVKDISANPATRQSSWWTPISPWIDKSDFVR